MRLKKAELWVILLTVAFLMLAVGWQLGTRHRAPGFSVTTASARTLPAETGVPADRSLPEIAADGVVDLNTASAEELKTLSGIGDVLAERIIAYRETYGPFQTVEDIQKVEGIGVKTYEANRDRMTVGTEGENE